MECPRLLADSEVSLEEVKGFVIDGYILTSESSSRDEVKDMFWNVCQISALCVLFYPYILCSQMLAVLTTLHGPEGSVPSLLWLVSQ